MSPTLRTALAALALPALLPAPPLLAAPPGEPLWSLDTGG